MRLSVIHALGLAAFCAAACGCAQWQHADECLVAQCACALRDRPPTPPVSHRSVVQASAIEATPSSHACSGDCSATGCGTCVSEAPPCPLCPLTACGACADCLGGRNCGLKAIFEPGPPPVRYVPPMPPKFLPVPTQPTLSPARPDAPEYRRGDVEMGYRSQMTFPSRD